MNEESPWKKIYEAGFEIGLTEPSYVAKKMAEMIPKGSRVLDGGCGKGRNSIFLANQGFLVDAIDTEDLHFVETLPDDIKDKVNFQAYSIMEFDIPDARYQGVLLARLIQYLKPEELVALFQKLSRGISKEGILAMSYKRSLGSGKINEKFELNNTDYDIEEIKSLLQQNSFNIEELLEDRASRDPSIPGSIPGIAYNIVSRKI